MRKLERASLVAAVVAFITLEQLPALAQAQPDGGNGPYTPPACVPGVPFGDITCSTGFDAWIEQFGKDGMSAGCGGGNYCPGTAVTRDQMAVFIEKAMRGTASWPPHTQLVWAVKASNGAPDPAASGQALLEAVAAIPASGNDAPSASNPWLLKIGPGIFDLGSSSLQIPAHVMEPAPTARSTSTTRTPISAGVGSPAPPTASTPPMGQATSLCMWTTRSSWAKLTISSTA